MILQTLNIYQQTTDSLFWFDFSSILLNIVLPVLILCALFYTLYKFYKLFKEISTSLKDISETYKRKNE